MHTYPDSERTTRRTERDLEDDLMGRTLTPAPRKRLFEGISVAQAIAASAAAATSMLLASRIGIAGSVIGAAVSSMVTVICSQLYRNALDASAEKLRLKHANESAYVGADMRSPTHGQVAHHTESPYSRTSSTAEAERPLAGTPTGMRPGARIAPASLLARAAAERSARARKVAIASAGIAIVAVLACAGIILASTSGQGLGTRIDPHPIANTGAASDGQNASEPKSPAETETPAPPEKTQPEPESPNDGTASDTPDERPGSDDGKPQPDEGANQPQPDQPQPPTEPSDTGASDTAKPNTPDATIR